MVLSFDGIEIENVASTKSYVVKISVKLEINIFAVGKWESIFQ